MILFVIVNIIIYIFNLILILMQYLVQQFTDLYLTNQNKLIIEHIDKN